MSNCKNILVIGSSGSGKKSWVSGLLNNPFNSKYTPLEKIKQTKVYYHNYRFNVILVPGQNSHIMVNFINLLQIDHVLIFIDSASTVSYKKAIEMTFMFKKVDILYHLVYNKSDIEYNKLDEITEQVSPDFYSVISCKMRSNIYTPLDWILYV